MLVKRWILCFLIALWPFSAAADVIAVSGSYQTCRENGEGEYLVLSREENGAEIAEYSAEDELNWRCVIEARSGETAAWAAQSAESGWLIAGASSEDEAGWHAGWYDQFQPQTDGWLAMLDGEGNLAWEHCYGGSGADVFWDICLGENCLILAGESESADGDLQGREAKQRDGWVVCVDMEGNMLWQNVCGGAYDDSLQGIAALEDGFLAAGWYTNQEGEKLGWLVWLDEQGQIKREWLADEPSAINDLAEGKESLLAVGVLRDSAWLLPMDHQGNILQSMIRESDISTRALCAAWYEAGFWAVGGESVKGVQKVDWLVQIHGKQIHLVQGTFEVEEETQ